MSLNKHARLSPSSATRWLNCPGSVALESYMPNESNAFSREGTAAHELAAHCLLLNHKTAQFIGNKMEVDGHYIEVDETMAGFVQHYVDVVEQYADGHTLMVEQRVSIGHITGEQGAEGTSDAIIITHDGDELIVVDLKYGMGVAVSAEANEQGQLYALGALGLVSMLGYEPKQIRIVIHQPRITGGLSEWVCTVDELMAYGKLVTAAAELCHEAVNFYNANIEVPGKYLSPGDKQCRFCKAKAVCPALRQQVIRTLTYDFEDESNAELGAHLEASKTAIPLTDNSRIAELLPFLDLIEDWCAAIRTKAHAELITGNVIPGYKLVIGRKGSRAWSSDADVELVLKTMRLSDAEMYTSKVISPAQAEKLLSKENPRRWATLQTYIMQSDGKPVVAPYKDKRPAIEVKPIIDEFDNVEAIDILY